VTTRELFRWAADWVAANADDPRWGLTVGSQTAPSSGPPSLSGDLAGESPRPRAGGGSRARSTEERQGTVASAAAAIREGRLAARDAVEACLARIGALDGGLRAFVTVLADSARADADRRDAERRAGRIAGPLHGVPVSVKDVIHVAGVPTTASSRVLHDMVPERDATAVARLRAAGAIIIGKTQTHEFALGVTTPQSRNPWDVTRIPGGSTGGGAIAVVAGMAPGALGTDTRASIRVPAALSGVVGFKPTFGLVPTDGVVTLSWSMDHVAPMAATVEDAALLLDAIAGSPGWSYRAFCGERVEGLRVGVPRTAFGGADSDVAAAVERAMDGLRAEGVSIVAVDEPSAADLEMTNAAGMVVSRAEAATLHRAWLATRADRYTAETFAQLDEAARVPATIYLAAQRLREAFRQRMLGLLGEVDALAMPTSLVLAPRVEEAERFLLVLSRNCIPWSFIGVPAVSVPCGRSPAGLPVGLQLVASPLAEGRLFALGAAVERLGLYKAELAE
jgi:aspartyl-tRNA(Asn)/glutamyl-tRNA(Gln) amidotransferase subunit A